MNYEFFRELFGRKLTDCNYGILTKGQPEYERRSFLYDSSSESFLHIVNGVIADRILLDEFVELLQGGVIEPVNVYDNNLKLIISKDGINDKL